MNPVGGSTQLPEVPPPLLQPNCWQSQAGAATSAGAVKIVHPGGVVAGAVGGGLVVYSGLYPVQREGRLHIMAPNSPVKLSAEVPTTKIGPGGGQLIGAPRSFVLIWQLIPMSAPSFAGPF